MPRTPYGFCVLQNAPQFWMHFEEISTALFIEATAGYMPKITNYEMFLNFNNVHRICLISTIYITEEYLKKESMLTHLSLEFFEYFNLKAHSRRSFLDTSFKHHSHIIKWFQAILMRLNCTTLEFE